MGNSQKHGIPLYIVHDDNDPHPVNSIAEPMFQLSGEVYCLILANCGHYACFEKHAKDLFFRKLDELFLRERKFMLLKII